MDQPRSRREIVRIALPIGLLVSLLVLGGYGILAQTSQVTENIKEQMVAESETPPTEPATTEPADPGPVRVALPKEVRGIYWTASTAGDPNKRRELTDYILKRNLNTVVIDLKMDNGAIAFPPADALLKPYAMDTPPIRDVRMLMDELGEKNIYRIARIAIMRDSVFATAHPEIAVQRSGGGLWRDKTGAAWLDPAAPEVSAYAIALGREAIAAGFDEVQYDYVRYPSDGVLSIVRYPISRDRDKAEVMRGFFEALNVLREEGVVVSYDLFGMTFWSSSHFGIGQRLEDAYPFADFISPMVYPSHYPPNFRGYENPALYPYEIVKQSLDKGAEMLEADRFIPQEDSRPKFRPWLQDFDIGAVYTAARIEAQIKAARDAGASGWMLWNARNVYEPAKYR
ncbi:hypothetical protein EDM68_03985 [Candidatus Uhrbacteria bacterium]|nr:MAG: hypothetical protein EDM68_03985 [Candidatus Uhrbacteria bacterium]